MFKKLKELFKKLNPMNAIEKWIIKNVAKKVVKALPDLEQKALEKGLEVIEKYGQELFAKVEILVVKFIEEHKD